MRVRPTVGKQSVPSGEKPTVHNVFILDRSSSMSGPKYTNAQKGINLEMEELKKSTDVNFTQTIVEFDNSGQHITHEFMSDLQKIKSFRGKGARGMTALYEAVGETLELLVERVPKGDKVLVKIFTDGGENNSNHKWYGGRRLKELIKEVESRGFTVTFEGTEQDTKSVINNLGIDATNTNIHKNTAASILENALVRSSATLSYSKSVAQGEDVSRGFYSKSIDKK